MAANETKIIDIDFDVDAGLKNLVQLQKEIIELTEAQKNRKKEGKEGTKEFVQTALEVKKLKREYNELQKVTNSNIAATKAQEGSIEQFRHMLDVVTFNWKKLSKEERDNTELGKKLTKSKKELTDSLKKLESQTGDNRRNVGNYNEAMEELNGTMLDAVSAMKEAAQAMNSFAQEAEETLAVMEASSAELGIFGNELSLIGTGAKKARAGLNVLSKGFKSLRAAILSSGIGALLAILAALLTYMTKTQKGIEFMHKATAVFSGITNYLNEQLIVLGGWLVAAWKNPQQAVKDLGNLIWTNLTNRLIGMAETIQALKKVGVATFTILKEKIKGVFGQQDDKALENAMTEAKEGAVELSKAIFKAGTGVEFTKETFDKLNKSIQKSIELELELLALKKNLRKEELRQLTANALLTRSMELQTAIADDNTKSFKERTEASIKAAKLSKKLAEEQLKLSILEEGIIKKEIENKKKVGSTTKELEEQLTELRAKRIESQTEVILRERDLEKQLSELKQDLYERDLDILIDGYDNFKTIQEQKINDETLTFETRLSLLKELEDEGQKSFDKQIETVQLFTKKKIDENELLNESDAVALNEKIRSFELSEIMEGRLLEIIRDRRIAVQDLNTQEKELTKEKLDRLKLEAEKLQELKQENELNLIQDAEKKALRELEIEKTKQLESLKEYKNYADLKKEIDKEYETKKKDIEEQFAQEKLQKKLDDLDNYKNLANQSVDILGSLSATKFNKRIKEFDESAKRQLANFKGTEEQKLKLEEKLEKNREKLKKEAFEKDKKFKLAQAYLDLGRELTAIALYASKNPSNSVTGGASGLATYALQSAVAVARSAANIAMVSSSKYERGGMLSGKRHPQGGIMIEAEDGEAVINRRSSAAFAPLLSAINAYKGWGDPFSSVVGNTYAERGTIADGGLTARRNEVAPQIIVEQPDVYVSVEEIEAIRGKSVTALERRNS